MRNALLGAALALGLVAAVAPTANATDFCFGNGSVIEVGAGGVNAAYLAVDSLFWEDDYWSIWIYAETNGVQGLQRGGVTLLGDADVCQDYEDHDQGVF